MVVLLCAALYMFDMIASLTTDLPKVTIPAMAPHGGGSRYAKLLVIF